MLVPGRTVQKFCNEAIRCKRPLLSKDRFRCEGTSASPLTPLFAHESLKLSSQEKQKSSSRVEMKIETGALTRCKFFATPRFDASVHH